MIDEEMLRWQRNVNGELDELRTLDRMEAAPVFNVRARGAYGDGSTDDTAAIQAAVDALPEGGGVVYLPPGTYYISDSIDLDGKNHVTFRGGEDSQIGKRDPTGRAGRVSVYCKDVTGYVFSLDGGAGGSIHTSESGITLEGITFDASNGAGAAGMSTTCTGVLEVTNGFKTGIYIRNVVAGWTEATNAAMFALGNAYLVFFENTHISHVMEGWGVKCDGNQVVTTYVFYRCYWHQCREAVYRSLHVTNIEFYSCIFESSLVAYAGRDGHDLFVGCYFENIGFQASGYTSTPLTAKQVDISFGGSLAADIDTAINTVYGNPTFLSCSFQDLNDSVGAIVSWFRGISASSSAGLMGSARFIACRSVQDASWQFFATDHRSDSNYNDYHITVEDGNYNRGIIKRRDDLNIVSEGHTGLNSTGNHINDGTQRVRNGRIIAHSTSSFPPTRGVWETGDIFVDESVEPPQKRVCTASGYNKAISGITVSTTNGSADVTFDTNAEPILPIGARFTIAGVTGTKRLAALDADGLGGTLDSAADATVSGASMTNASATFSDGEIFVIDYAGAEVGVGGPPSFRLDVQENAAGYIASFFNDGNNDNRQGIIIQRGSDSNPGGNFVSLLDGDGDQVGRIAGDGAGGTDYNTSSDRRLKEDITPLASSLDRIMALRPVEYRGKGADRRKRKTPGFMAQEVAQAIPAAAHYDEESDLYSIAWNKLIPALVGAVQELAPTAEWQQTQIDDLQQQVNDLRDKLANGSGTSEE